MRKEQIVRRIGGVLLLPLFPVVVLMDVWFGEVATGVKTTTKQSIIETWSIWLDIYIKD